QIFGDGVARAEATRMLSNGDVPHIKYSLIMPLVAVPWNWMGDALGHRLAVLARFNLAVFAMWLAVMWVMLRPRLGERHTRRFLVIVAGASYLAPYLVEFNAEAFSTMCVTAGLVLLMWGYRTSTRIAGLVVAVIGTANIPAMVPAVALGAIVVVIRTRQWRVALVPLLAFVLVVIESSWERGSLAMSKYDLANEMGAKTVLPYSGLPGFRYPPLFGVLSIVFSFGKGLVFFVPALFLAGPNGASSLASDARLANARAIATLRWCLVAVVAGLVIMYSRWWSWYAGQSYGNRFFVIAAIPAALALVHAIDGPKRASGADEADALRSSRSALGSLLVIAVVALSVWVTLMGLVFNVRQPALGFCHLDNDALEHLCWYTPEYSFLWSPFVYGVHWHARDLLLAAASVVVAAWAMIGPVRVLALRGRQWLAQWRSQGTGWTW
ncbi:MAG: hypothetical protein AB7N61_27895, partial [Acidimicrobiia bacterium]